jgi:hypothetical protein
MKNLVTLFKILLFGSLSSCGIYRQNVINVPLLQQKGQVQLGGHYSFTGYDVQAAIAISNKLAILGNYNSTGKKETNYSLTNYTRFNHDFYEFGGGHFRKSSKGLISEYYLLIGKGTTTESGAGGDNIVGHTAPYTYKRNANYLRYMVQVNFGKSKNKFEYAISPRLFIIDFRNIVNTENNTYLTLPHTFLWTDIAFTIRYCPTTYLKLSGQISGTIPISGLKAGFYEASPFNCSLGLIFNLNTLRKL